MRMHFFQGNSTSTRYFRNFSPLSFTSHVKYLRLNHQLEMGPTFLVQFLCAWFQCEFGPMPPFIYTNPDNRRLLPPNPLSTSFRSGESFSNEPVVHTNLGPIRGFRMKISESREIFSFTGVPYGESTAGANRFRDPVPRRPWKGTWDATYPSPFCVQSSATLGNMIRGQEECLFLDIYTPKIPQNGDKNHPLLPVIMWIPAGSSTFGRSRFYGPKYFLREDVILVPINHRVGLFGYLSTGDEHCSGNWALKDQALSVEWVHNNIKAFGGDPNRIIIGGISSGGSTSHLMLFTNHRARNLIKGIIAMSGTALVNQALDAVGQVREMSDLVADSANCPNSTARDGSWRMVQCLQSMDPYMLAARFASASPLAVPPLQFRPVIEPRIPSAFISELPEVQYRKGKVPPIPLVVTRSRDEVMLVVARLRLALMLLLRPRYYELVPKFLHNFFRNTDRKVRREEAMESLQKVNLYYFNRTNPPNFLVRREHNQFMNLMNDALYFAPMWKSIEYHHHVGPTYASVTTANVLAAVPLLRAVGNLNQLRASHAMEYLLLFNNSKIAQPLKGDLEKVSEGLVNIIANFAKYGTPLYRTPEGELLSIWKPVRDMRNPIALTIDLPNVTKMIQDPVAVSNRWRIWENVVF